MVFVTWILNESLSLFIRWHGGAGYPEIVSNGDMGEGAPKIAIFAVTSFLNGPLSEVRDFIYFFFIYFIQNKN